MQPPPTTTATPIPTHSPTPSPTATVTPLPTLTPTPLFTLCSPIEGFQLTDLQMFITQPFDPPTPRLDNGHHGLDIAFFSEGSRPQILGLSIQSILPGRVAAVLNNNGPYGNMIMVETPLENIPLSFQDVIPFPTVAPTVTSDARLLCPPEGEFPTYNTTGKRSLYILYAHMIEPPSLKLAISLANARCLGMSVILAGPPTRICTLKPGLARQTRFSGRSFTGYQPRWNRRIIIAFGGSATFLN